MAREARMQVEGENVGEILDGLVEQIGNQFKNELFNEDMIIKSRYLLLLNGRRVGKDETSQTQVSSGDKLMIIAPIAGG
jgi:molybdopterin converting factor small subunit